MFILKEFVLKTLRGMVGNYPEFQIREFALNWYAKGVLTDDDLATIEEWFAPVEEDEEVIEEDSPVV